MYPKRKKSLNDSNWNQCHDQFTAEIKKRGKKVRKIIDTYNEPDECPIEGSRVTWLEYRRHFANAICRLYENDLIPKDKE